MKKPLKKKHKRFYINFADFLYSLLDKVLKMDPDTLYDEFGNYIGPELESDEVSNHM